MAWTLPNQMFAGGFTFPFPSNWANVINFVLFDIVLITVVYTASSDVAGRLNHYDTSGGKPCRLHLCSPPIVGGGICSTRKLHAHMLLACRVVALALVLLSNLSIEGSDHAHIYTTKAYVRAPGTLRGWDERRFLSAVATRSGCQVTNDRGEAIYGDLRRNKVSNQFECVADPDLLDKPLVTGIYQEVDVRAGTCNHRFLFRRTNGMSFNVTAHFCKGATLRCASTDDGRYTACTGVFQGVGMRANYTYLCDDGVMLVPNTQRIGCLPVRNFDRANIGWMYALNFTFPPPFIIDEINAMYAAGVQRKLVKASRRQAVTHVSPMWFLVMALKVCIAGVLIIGSCFLRNRGHLPVAHDENTLAQLISAGIQLPEEDHPPQYCNSNNNSDHGDSNMSLNDTFTSKSWKSTSNMSTSSDIFLNADNSRDGNVVVYAEGYNASGWSSNNPSNSNNNNNPNHEIDQMERQHW